MSGVLLAGKVAMVTGAASGIGRAAAIAYAQEGARVMVADVNVAGGKETVALIRSAAGISGKGVLDYCASKHAVVGMTRSAALRYAGLGIRVNAVCPGVIETPMSEPLKNDPVMLARMTAMCPIGRMGKAEEVADVVIWLSSPKSSFVTGQVIAVDGGFMA